MDKALLTQAVEEKLAGTEYFVTEISIDGQNKNILVEIDAQGGVSIDFCVELNRFLAERFPDELGEYDVEVSSAGIGQPLKTLRQYKKFEGEEMEVLTGEGKKLRGVLRNPTDDGFVLDVTVMEKPEGKKRKVEVVKNFPLKYDEIKYTKYLIKF